MAMCSPLPQNGNGRAFWWGAGSFWAVLFALGVWTLAKTSSSAEDVAAIRQQVIGLERAMGDRFTGAQAHERARAVDRTLDSLTRTIENIEARVRALEAREATTR